ncbi:HNH endonuclease family protein [Nocardia terpenica]|uniref:HNH endonuclease family protein n=1 Tax=Nocardia terpenica TaxID=455432 RepID=UPI00397EAC1A
MQRGKRGWGRAALAAVVLVAVLLAAGCSLGPGGPPAPGSPSRAELERLLAAVRIVDSRPHPGGYERGCGADQGCVFGPAWTDVNRSGCDARNSVLARQLAEVRVRPDTGGCVVVAGVLRDPYTGRRIEFRRAQAREVQIDHVYPLAAAWDMGASNWPLPQRVRFANDVELNLLAVDGATNEDKRDRTPAEWLPPARPYRCFYAGKYLTTATRYDLPVTRADRDALARVARRCP